MAGLAMLLAGCANKYEALTPDVQAGMMADLKAGKLSLDCGATCSFTWISQASAIHALDIAERWNDLAVRVMQIGFGQDLAYYYLGQAAQGLGYHEAAIGYYNYAYGLASSQNPILKCQGSQIPGGSDPCQGVDLAASIPVLIQASKDAIAQQEAADAAAASAAAAPAPVHHHHHVVPAAASSQAPGWVAPPPAAAPAAGGSGWVAPPPATP